MSFTLVGTAGLISALIRQEIELSRRSGLSRAPKLQISDLKAVRLWITCPVGQPTGPVPKRRFVQNRTARESPSAQQENLSQVILSLKIKYPKSLFQPLFPETFIGGTNTSVILFRNESERLI